MSIPEFNLGNENPETLVQRYIAGMNEKRRQNGLPDATYQIEKDDEGKITGVLRVREDAPDTITSFQQVSITVKAWNRTSR